MAVPFRYRVINCAAYNVLWPIYGKALRDKILEDYVLVRDSKRSGSVPEYPEEKRPHRLSAGGAVFSIVQ